MISKSTLDRFIGRYHLFGTIESVQIISDESKTSVSARDEGRNTYAFISVDSPLFPAGTFNISNTSQLKTLLGVLGNDIDIKPQITNGRPMAFAITDGTTKVKYALAEPVLIPTDATTKKLPEPEISITIDKKFTDTFGKAAAALSCEEFTVEGTDAGVNIILGYEEYNANNIVISPTVIESDLLKPMQFSADVLKNIISANKDAGDGILTVSSKGIATITFALDQWSIQYYLLRRKAS